ncbi:leucine rich repeat-containing protein [Cystoisospora suis]|uniref:Leucine rich repeat-containing protein n=1 Tax=Cystoisospora suis TaxID=483139 RepID=A0A2C6KYP4_9APIC|nr:leucine rich repeat-containing protein [Cystoisospora suis]
MQPQNQASTWHVLRAVTGHFDPTTVCVFNGQNTSFSLWKQELPLCTNLLYLNLSNCGLSNISALFPLTQLTHLDISHNSIMTLDQINRFKYLENLRAVANPITRFQDVRDLSGLHFLTSLSLQNIDQSDACPVCRIEDYKARILYLLPQTSSHGGSKTETPRIVVAPGGSPRSHVAGLRTRLRSLDGLRVQHPDVVALADKGLRIINSMKSKTEKLRDRITEVCNPIVLGFTPLDEDTELFQQPDFSSCHEELALLKQSLDDAKKVLAQFEDVTSTTIDPSAKVKEEKA